MSRSCSGPCWLSKRRRAFGYRAWHCVPGRRASRRAGSCRGGQRRRALDQNARAEMRKLGIRFGAYHIFVPALMKPARAAWPRSSMPGQGWRPQCLREVSHLAFSGRTSIPVDPSIDKDLYRIARLPVAGPRDPRGYSRTACRSDSPSIAYRPGVTDGAPPAGTADGDGFVVTGNDLACRLCRRRLWRDPEIAGYRAEMRPGPAISVPLKGAAAPAMAARFTPSRPPRQMGLPKLTSRCG